MTTDVEILKMLMQFLESGKKVALSIVIEKKGSGPRGPGAKMIVSEDGQTFGTIGGGKLETVLINESLKTIEEGKPKKAIFSLSKEGRGEAIKTGLICGGELTIFIDVIEPKPKLILIGAGHIAIPLAKIADIVGFDIAVVDDNGKLANKDRFPMAKEIITGNFNEILDKIEVKPRDFVVVVHGEPEHDYLALEKTIKMKPAFVGLLGSKAKAATLIKRLKEAGISEADLKPLHAPLGLDIGAQTAEEIAVSILAEIIKERRRGS